MASLKRTINLAVKRLFDISAATAVGVACAPLLPVFAAVVKLESPGPVFFVQSRVGKDARTFLMWKFRTMRAADAPPPIWGWTASEQSRVTRFGSIMREFGLDELPQIANIIRGDMSIIGPRPPLPEQVEEFGPHLLKMFDMRPGVLNLAVVRGRRSLPEWKRYEMHVEYVDQWSLLADLEILLRSAGVVLRRQNANDEIAD